MMSGETAVAAAAGVERCLVSAAAGVEGVAPGALLGFRPGEPRGFWAREGRWFAHLGAAAEVRVAPSAAGSGDRFRTAWAQARGLRVPSGRERGPGRPPPPPRFFGGFSFLADHQAEGVWEAFPPARFILPELELQGEGERGTLLTLRRIVPPGADPARHEAELGEELDLLREALGNRTGRPLTRSPGPGALSEETDAAAWGRAVERILGELGEGGVSKVVLARALSLQAEDRVDPVEVALTLWRQNPGAHVFYFEPVAGQALVGAAPETVATVRDGRFSATAVAGSVGPGRCEEERRALAGALLASEKDRREHRLCVQDMVERLLPRAREVRARGEPRVLSLPAIQHLETVIEAELEPGETILSVLEALHPTPAVCGLPRDRALDLLREEEPFQRGWYAGPVGWFDTKGNGVFAPALRSAVIRGRDWRLFAGAGIVAGSVPEQEWEETRIKFQPILQALAGEEG